MTMGALKVTCFGGRGVSVGAVQRPSLRSKASQSSGPRRQRANLCNLPLSARGSISGWRLSPSRRWIKTGPISALGQDEDEDDALENDDDEDGLIVPEDDMVDFDADSFDEDEDEEEEEENADAGKRRRRKEVTDLDEDEEDEDDEDDDDEDVANRDVLDDVLDAEDADENDTMMGRAVRRGNSIDEEDEDEAGDEFSMRSFRNTTGTTKLPTASQDEPDLDLDAFLIEQGMPRASEPLMEEVFVPEADELRLDDDVDDIDEWVKSWPKPPERSFQASELLEMAGLQQVAIGAPQDLTVTGVASDSRKVKPGDIYVCIEGSKADGHDYAVDAAKAGAIAVVASLSSAKLKDLEDLEVPILKVADTSVALSELARAFYEDPSSRLLTVGITGTNGKTTTSWLVRGILEEAEHLTGMVGTIEYALCNQLLSDSGELWKDTPEGQERDIQEIIQEEWDQIHFETKAAEEGRARLLAHSLPYHLDKYQGRYSVPNTTPSSLQIQQLMAGMADRGGSACVMECSSIGLDQGRCDAVDYDVAVFMNLSKEHMDYHGSMQEYLDAKARLFEGLTDPGRQRAVINVDDVYADQIKAAAGQVPVVTFAVNDRTADVTVETMGLTTLQETDITISTPLGSFQVITPLIGLANIYNLLAATAVGISINIPIETIAAGLEAVDCVPGRLEKIEEGQAFTVIVDYAHTPDALEYLLNTVKSVSGIRRTILVFGCGGDRDKEKRKVMMEIANEKADIVIVTTDNPRSEDPQQIFDDMSYGLPKYWGAQPQPNGDYTWFADPSTSVPWENNLIWDKQSFYKRYVVEDRHYAIRGALSIADEKDVVIIAGKGHEDYEEWEVDGELVRGWFSDQQEVRSAVNVLGGLYKVPMNRKNLPWEAL